MKVYNMNGSSKVCLQILFTIILIITHIQGLIKIAQSSTRVATSKSPIQLPQNLNAASLQQEEMLRKDPSDQTSKGQNN